MAINRAMGPSFVRPWGETRGEKGRDEGEEMEEFTSTPGGISFVRLRRCESIFYGSRHQN